MSLPAQLHLDALDLHAAQAIILHGSYARGDFTARSDVDLHLIYTALPATIAPFQVVEVNGYRVELHAGTVASVQQKMHQRPAWAHSWLRAEHIDGDRHTTQTLIRHAQGVLEEYRVPPEEINATRHWIASAVQKMADAAVGDDWAYAGYLVATNTWELLSGLWQVNHLPIPAARLTFLLTPTLSRLPADFPRLYSDLWSGDLAARVAAYLILGRWVIGAGARI